MTVTAAASRPAPPESSGGDGAVSPWSGGGGSRASAVTATWCPWAGHSSSSGRWPAGPCCWSAPHPKTSCPPALTSGDAQARARAWAGARVDSGEGMGRGPCGPRRPGPCGRHAPVRICVTPSRAAGSVQGHRASSSAGVTGAGPAEASPRRPSVKALGDTRPAGGGGRAGHRDAGAVPSSVPSHRVSDDFLFRGHLSLSSCHGPFPSPPTQGDPPPPRGPKASNLRGTPQPLVALTRRHPRLAPRWVVTGGVLDFEREQTGPGTRLHPHEPSGLVSYLSRSTLNFLVCKWGKVIRIQIIIALWMNSGRIQWCLE